MGGKLDRMRHRGEAAALVGGCEVNPSERRRDGGGKGGWLAGWLVTWWVVRGRRLRSKERMDW